MSNEVKLTFTADTSDADKGFQDIEKGSDTAGKSAKAMGDKVHESSGKLADFTEKSDKAQKPLRGIGDLAGGASGALGLFGISLPTDQIATFSQAAADLAGGFADTLGPALDKIKEKLGFATVATEAQTVATGEAEVAEDGLNLALLANPIVLIGALIVGLVVLVVELWKHCQTFRDIVRAVWDAVKAAFQTAWEVIKSVFGLIKDAVTGVWKWITDKFGAVIDFIKGLPGKIRSAASGMWDGIKDAFRAVINFIIDGWNRLHFHIPGFHVGPIGFDGFDLGLPQIPHMAHGGRPTGPTIVGEYGPEMFIPDGGGQIIPHGQGGPGGMPQQVAVYIDFTGTSNDDLVNALRKGIRVRGSNVQTVLGSY